MYSFPIQQSLLHDRTKRCFGLAHVYVSIREALIY